MADIVNINRVRKKKAAGSKDKAAAENRTKFGRTKAEKDRERAEKERAAQALNDRKLEDDD